MSDSAVEITAPKPTGPGRPLTLAALKEGLAPEKRALAEDLRALFGALDVSVRRYAVRRHLDASSVTRYLSGERVPPWEFVAGLIGDVREVSAPLTPAAEAALHETHRAALKTNRRSSEMQTLQDELAVADEETRRIKARQRALEEAIVDRERTLQESVSRCRRLEVQIDEEQSAHRADIALWEGEYEQIRRECHDLSQEVLFLQEALAVARAELIAAEGQCHQLEADLDAMSRLEGRGEGASSLMAALEAANSTASVAELVQVVGDLEARTQQAMARELVSAASRSRRVEEVAALLSGLQEAGLPAHADTAIPALVMTRPVAETAALAGALHRAGFEDGVAALLRASVELHSPCDVIGLCLGLHRDQLDELAESLLAAAFVVRPVAEAVAIAVWAAGTEVEQATVTALGPAFGRRGAQELVELSIALRAAGRHRHADTLPTAVAERRDARAVVNVIECFTDRGLASEADRVFAVAQERSVPHVLALVRALVQGRHSGAVGGVVEQAVARWSAREIATMITDLYNTDHFPQAAQALMSALHSPTVETRLLLHQVDEVSPGAEAVVGMVADTGSPERAAHLLLCLESGGLPLLAEVVFEQTLTHKPTGHTGQFLGVLAQSGAAVMSEAGLYERACSAAGPDMAPLLLALATARQDKAVASVALGCIRTHDLSDLVVLLRQLHKLDNPIQPRGADVVDQIVGAVVQNWPMEDQASLVVALAQAGLPRDSALLTHRAAASRPKFRSLLRHEQTKHAQKVLSRTFWRKGPTTVSG
ncbi:hypothetical protein GTY40_15310 [Streptomyces sp. SID8359]|uniref:hypothetical protein n=1 Tax=unclassified Streptomyces TaxID=2593676 RepID=UPI00067CEBE1|nr:MULTISPECIES: hypothetical protein [unclassified Streptomyces]MYT92401.1 hypothetical protein [Streptomyces sp. SID8359]